MPATRASLIILACTLTGAAARAQGNPPPATQPPQQQAPATRTDSNTPPVTRRGPRPYAQVITARARTERGAITVHRVDDRYYFEVPDSMMGRDYLMVTRVSGVPAGSGGFQSAGSSVNERMVRWHRANDRVILQVVTPTAVADDSLPIAKSVAENNYGPIIGAFPIAAFARDSNAYVVDVTDFFATDNPATSGLGAAARRQFGVRRFDPARSYVASVRGFPINIEVRQVQTFDAATPPTDVNGSTVTIETRESFVLLPKVPMRPRKFDPRVGFFTVDRVNYGLDEQKAASEEFITRWRLEPKDPAAYARGELVEPIKPIVYYIDPATPTKWRRYVKEGVENWQKVFEKAGFKNAIIARDAPNKEEDPDFDPDDARYSMVRWAASLVRNAVGPHTHDPRSGEIINSEITWYHNHMRSYRNWLIMETGAANPMARSLEIPEELMGETMRQVITHEIGHALGLQHNMMASASFPVDSLRSPSFTHKYGVSATIMDYARQNYVAQPGDGLQPKDFIRRLGPFDDFAINWGYRVIPVKTAKRRETHPQRLDHETARSVPLPLCIARLRQRRSAESDGGPGRRSGEGDGVWSQELQEGAAAIGRLDDQARRRLRGPSGAVRGDGESLGRDDGPRGGRNRRSERRSQDRRHRGRRIHRRAEGKAEGRAGIPRGERDRDPGVAGTEGHSIEDRSEQHAGDASSRGDHVAPERAAPGAARRSRGVRSGTCVSAPRVLG